jgi:hypothetical protein
VYPKGHKGIAPIMVARIENKAIIQCQILNRFLKASQYHSFIVHLMQID